MDEFWSKLLQEVAVQVLPLLAVMAAGYVVKVLAGVWADFKFSQPDKAHALEQAVALAVKAAEQAGAAEYIYDKKDYALTVAEKWLAMRGIKMDLDLVDAAIEAAVYEHFNQGAKPLIGIDDNDIAVGGTLAE